jgi:hypothetical protein
LIVPVRRGGHPDSRTTHQTTTERHRPESPRPAETVRFRVTET